jgi:hypothetical protein
MILIYKGLPGAGKTAALAHYGIQALKEGREVYSNFWLNYEGENLHYWSSIEELLMVENGLILMDEAQIYLNSRLWELLPQQFQYKLQLHRHDGLDIVGTVQHEARLDVVMRELVSVYVQCRFVGFRGHGFIVKSAYHPEEVKSARGVPYRREILLLSQKLKSSYDTMQKLDNTDFEKDIVTVKYRVCNKCGNRRKIG